MSATKRVSIQALGCPKAIVDAEQLLAVSAECGYELSMDVDDCDILLINTCSFIESARLESFEVIEESLEMKRQGKVEKVIVTGCLPQIMVEELKEKYPEIDGFLGAGNNSSLADILSGKSKSIVLKNDKKSQKGILPRFRITLPHVSYLRVAEGCSHGCTFCKIPTIRGKFKSFPLDDILIEAKSLVDSGAKELVIIAQDTSIVGLDAELPYTLSKLTDELSKIKNLEWIRLLYINPMHFNEDTLRAFKSSRVLPYFEIPIQHANDKVLRAMGRSAPDKDGIRKIINNIRNNFDNPTIRTTAIVGFPGEGEKEFEELHDFIQEIKFDRLGVFTYSPEIDTPAYSMERVSDEVASKRQEQLLMTQSDISLERNSKLRGKVITVIVDQIEEGIFIARSQSDAPDIDCIVNIESPNLEIGDIVNVRITGFDHYDLTGVVDGS